MASATPDLRLPISLYTCIIRVQGPPASYVIDISAGTVSTSSKRRHLRPAAYGDLVQLQFKTTRHGKHWFGTRYKRPFATSWKPNCFAGLSASVTAICTKSARPQTSLAYLINKKSRSYVGLISTSALWFLSCAKLWRPWRSSECAARRSSTVSRHKRSLPVN